MNLLEMSSLLQPEVQQSPNDYHHALLAEGLHYDAQLGMHICASYPLMREILRDTATFSNIDSQSTAGMRRPPEEAERIRRSGYQPANTLVTNDPPDHTRIRKMIDDPFRPRSIEKLTSDIQHIVDDVIDTCMSKGHFDAVVDMAIPVPILVIADMLGLDRSLAGDIKRWSDASVEPLGMMVSDERLIECAQTIKDFQDIVASELKQRQSHPTDDLLTALVQARDTNGKPYTLEEMISLTQQFLVAGNETTTNGIAAGVRMLIESPDQAQKLRTACDVNLTRIFVNEVLRLESPVQGLFRVVTKDVELAGVTLAAGSRIMLRFAAANRDPAKYAEPDQLDLARKNAGTHLAFGAGIHHCIGANLAREEMTLTFHTLLQRSSTLAFTPGLNDFEHHPSLILRGLKALHVSIS